MARLQHPIVIAHATADEDRAITDPRDRLARWGQPDHVRTYGADYESRLVDAGFDVQVIPYHETLSPNEAERYRLQDHGTSRSRDIAVCRPKGPGPP